MKKLLALLLVVLMLFGFGAGAAALTPEEELEAEGRALLIQTMEDLRGDYTINNGIVHSNGNYAIINGDGTRELHLGAYIYRVFPNQKGYQKLESSEYFDWYNSDLVRSLEPKEVTEDTPIRIEELIGANIDFYVVFDGFSYGYERNTGTLTWIKGSTWEMDVKTFRKEANISLLSLDGMREASALQVKWWDFLADPWKPILNFDLGFSGIVLWSFFDLLMHAPILLPFYILLLPFILIRGLFGG